MAVFDGFPVRSRTSILKRGSSCCLLQYRTAVLTGSHSGLSVFTLHWIECGAGTYSLSEIVVESFGKRSGI